jgi:hypothetical protein
MTLLHVKVQDMYLIHIAMAIASKISAYITNILISKYIITTSLQKYHFIYILRCFRYVMDYERVN